MSSRDTTINPLTGRPIKIGGKVWKGLVKNSIILTNSDRVDDKILYKLKSNTNIPKKIKEINNHLPDDLQCVKGRGQYVGHLVKRKKRISTQNTIKAVSKKATNIIKKNKRVISEMTDREIEQFIEKQILDELEGQTGDIFSIKEEVDEESDEELDEEPDEELDEESDEEPNEEPNEELDEESGEESDEAPEQELDEEEEEEEK
jgi:hypothetical protein